MKHSKHLLGCALAIIVGLLLVDAFDVQLGALAFLVCPLLMVFMMKGMNHDNSADHEHDKNDSSPPRSSGGDA